MKYIIKVIWATGLFFALPLTSHAHLMVAQHGTLNISPNGVYMVLSLPVSSFNGIDDNHDGKLSKKEFDKYQYAISKVVHSKVTLSDDAIKRPLNGLILSPVFSHHKPTDPVSQIVVMGKFMLATENANMTFQVDLYGKTIEEQTIKVTASDKRLEKINVVNLTPDQSHAALFSE